MKIKNIIFSFLIIPLVFLSGCSERQQIHQKLIVQGIGVDKNEKKYTLTVQALDFQNPLSKDEPNVKTIEIKGVSLVEALENISKQTNLTPVYSQNLVLIIGESVAEEGVNNFMDFFVRHFETRPKVKICVTKGEASKLFKLKLNSKPLKAKNISDLIPNELNSDILHFVSNLKNKISDPSAAWIDVESQESGENACMKGAAIFSEDSLKGFLEGDEAFGFMLLKGVPSFGSCMVEVDEVGNVTCAVNKISSKISAAVEESVPVFNINLDAEESAFSVDRKFDASFDENLQFLIRDKFSEKVTEFCESVINKLISTESDVLNLGKILKNFSPGYFKTLNKKWQKYLKECRYKIDKKVTVTVIGKEPM